MEELNVPHHPNAFVYNRREAEVESEDLPGDPEESQPYFTFDEAQAIDRIIHQFNIENGCNPICLATFPALADILYRYPNITHYHSIPTKVGVPYAGSPYGQQAILINAMRVERDRINLEIAIDEQQMLLEQENFPEALQVEEIQQLTLAKLDEMITQMRRFEGDVYTTCHDEDGTFDPDDRSAGYEARVKNIENKLPMSLWSPLVLAHVAKVLKHGSIKYGNHMWREDPQPFSNELDSINRHWLALVAGQDIDPDSGEPHLALIICRAMFLLERSYTHPELDDRHVLRGEALNALNRMLYPTLYPTAPMEEVDKCWTAQDLGDTIQDSPVTGGPDATERLGQTQRDGDRHAEEGDSQPASGSGAVQELPPTNSGATPSPPSFRPYDFRVY